jgi:hypothetical protein
MAPLTVCKQHSLIQHNPFRAHAYPNHHFLFNASFFLYQNPKKETKKQKL